jgi:putative methyltransferase (TIGR04325 family)
MKVLQTILKKITPPIILEIVKALFFTKKSKYGFQGNYTNWEEASKQTTGWETDIILDKINQSTNQLEKQNSSFERDGEIISSINQNFPLMYSLIDSINIEKKELSIIDFGGSLGAHYNRYRQFINNVIKISWAIVEQKKYVDYAKKINKNLELNFHYSISEALKTNNYNTFLSSGTIQYIEKPYKLMDEIMEYNFSTIIFDRIFFLNDVNDRICIQKVNPELFYDASFPVWLFNEDNFKKHMSKKYTLISEFMSEDGDNQIEGIRIYHKGFYYKLNY